MGGNRLGRLQTASSERAAMRRVISGELGRNGQILTEERHQSPKLLRECPPG